MNISEAKQVRIVDFLAQLGHHAQYVKSEQHWYLSPLREERTPSFKVNDRLNEWYDFGEATGGDLVELGKYLCRTESVSEALAYIERPATGASLPRVRVPVTPPRPIECDMKGLVIVPLRHHALLSYLHSRMIDADIGRMFCRGSTRSFIRPIFIWTSPIFMRLRVWTALQTGIRSRQRRSRTMRCCFTSICTTTASR